jgi:membrane AbrB-like protein
MKTFAVWWPRQPWRVLGTLVLATLAALAFEAMNTPIPWMLGPLVVVSCVSLVGAPTVSHLPLRNVGQWVIGTALGLYFTPQMAALVGTLWWAVLLSVVWAVVLGLLFSAWVYKLNAETLGVPQAQMRATAYFAGSIGGASEMTLLAEREGARSDLVAASHSLRVLMVTLTIPFAVQFWGVTGLDATDTFKTVLSSQDGLWLLMATGGGVWLAQKLKRANPWFMGALVASMLLAVLGLMDAMLPTWLTNAGQLFIGISLGVQFRPAFLRTAPRWLGTVAAGTLSMMLLCAAFAWGLSWVTGLHPATLLLATSPGGIAEMAITAKVLQLGVPVVTAFQVSRLVVVLIIAEPLYRYGLKQRFGGAQ